LRISPGWACFVRKLPVTSYGQFSSLMQAYTYHAILITSAQISVVHVCVTIMWARMAGWDDCSAAGTFKDTLHSYSLGRAPCWL